MTIQVFGSQATVCYLNRAFNDTSPSNAIYEQQLVNAQSIGDTAFANTFGQNFSGLSNAELSKKVLTNMGILPTTDTSVASLEPALTDYFGAFGKSEAGGKGEIFTDTRGFIVLQLANILANFENSTGSLAVYNAAAVAWNSEISTCYMYSVNTTNTTSSINTNTADNTNQTTFPISKKFAVKNDMTTSYDWNTAADTTDSHIATVVGYLPSPTELVITN